MHLTQSFGLEINWVEAPFNYLKHCLQFDMKREPRLTCIKISSLLKH